ncbi:hypothetical protein D8674_023849 [Pyrus ussuriensis x Pyrus communis]|uniref:Uncharacterized protein n=1 Tax=Pyrus ussuriensis x Pyrus communis TaxID=2448454 RepID=A0A5N5H379_9ROSA|nr:hypothetical protein D8674_023849 [Pyrus ussuriensis x Pyrus communis]
MASSNKNTKSPNISPYNLPQTKVRWEPGEGIHAVLRHRQILSVPALGFILEFRMLPNIRIDFNDCYYFSARLSLIWESYIQDVPCQDKDYFTDILVVDGNWKREINGVKIRAHIFYSLEFNNKLEEIEVCHPKLINLAMQIHTAHHN